MSKNLITKFRKFWRTLSPLEQRRMYDIMTALRGEDDGNARVKNHTTARIRGLLFGAKLAHKGVKGFFTPNPRKIDNVTVHFLRGKMGRHFSWHICEAIAALKPYVEKKKFVDLKKFL